MNIVKKIAVTIMFLCVATVANAQDQGFKIGVRFGSTDQKLSLYNLGMIPSIPDGFVKFNPVRVGWYIGAVFSIPAGPVVIAPEVAFMHRRNYDDVIFCTYVYQSEMAVSVPILVKFFPTQRLYLQAGVQVDIPIAPEECIEDDCVAMDGKNGTIERAAIDLGIPFGIGYMIIPNLGFDFRFVIGLTAHSEIEHMNRKMENGTLTIMSLGFTYFF